MKHHKIERMTVWVVLILALSVTFLGALLSDGGITGNVIGVEGELEIQGSVCGGAYSGGNWRINESVTCSNEAFVVNGTLIIADDSDTVVAAFNALTYAKADLSGNNAPLSAAIPDLSKTTPSQYTADWDSETNHEFYIAMNESEHILQLFINTTGKADYVYGLDIDASDVSGTNSGAINGADLLVGYYNSGGYLGPIVGCYNGAAWVIWVNGNESSSGQEHCNLDSNLVNNFTVYWNQSNSSVGSVWEIAIEVNNTWVNKETSTSDSKVTTFTNYTLNSTAYGNLTLNNVSLNLEDQFNVSANTRFTAGDASTIQFMLSENASINTTFGAGSTIIINDSTITVNDTEFFWGLRVETDNYILVNNSFTNHGLLKGGYDYGNAFTAATGGLIFNNTFGDCDTNVGRCIDVAGAGTGFNISGNHFTNQSLQSSAADGITVENNIVYGLVTFQSTTSNINFTNNTFFGEVRIEFNNSILKNNNFTDESAAELNLKDINDSNVNTLIYSNSFGEIRWENKTNLTVNISFGLGDQIFLSSNNLSLAENSDLANLNSSAQLTFYNLNDNATHQMVRDETRCDNTNTCNITSDDGNTTVVQVTSFSDYTTQDLCDAAITTSTTLTANYICDKTAINLAASDIILDCAGYIINYSTGGTVGYGIHSNSGYGNVTIKNCQIYEGVTSTIRKYGINIINNQNGTIENNNISTIGEYGQGIYFSTSTNTNITHNLIITTGDDSNGINLGSTSTGNIIKDNVINTSGTGSAIMITDSSSFNNVSNNNLTTTGSSAEGIEIGDTSSSTIVSNNIISTSGSLSHGIGSATSSANTEVINNNITTGGSTALGLSFQNGNNANIVNNTITTAGDSASGPYFYVFTNSNITGNTVTTSGNHGYGIYLSSVSNSNTVVNNIFITSGDNAYGVYSYLTTDLNIDNNTINTSGNDAYGVHLAGSSSLTVLLNNNISANTYEIFDTTGGSNTNYLIYNNSFGQINWSKTDLDTNITLGINKNVFLENNLVGLTDDSEADNLNGVAAIEISSLSYTSTPFLNKDGVRCDNTDACNISYDVSLGILSANVSSFSNYTTEADVECGTVTTSITLNKNLTSEGTCFTVTTAGITIDGAGYTINGSISNTTAYGIRLNADDAVIKNINIETFGGAGVYTPGVGGGSNFLVNNSNFTGNRYALRVSEGEDINFTNNRISSGTVYGVYLGLDYSWININDNVFVNTPNAIAMEGDGAGGANTFAIDNNITMNSSSTAIIFATNDGMTANYNNITYLDGTTTTGKGIRCDDSSYSNNITGNRITGASRGIEVEDCSAPIFDNVISDSDIGIFASCDTSGDPCDMVGNIINNSNVSLYIENDDDNIDVTNNWFINSQKIAINLTNSDDVTFADNNYTDNELDIYLGNIIDGVKTWSNNLNFTTPVSIGSLVVDNRTNVTFANLTLGSSSTAQVNFMNLTINHSGATTDRINTTRDFSVNTNQLFLNVTTATVLNTTANITFNDVSYTDLASFNILEDGASCANCTKISASPVQFEVIGFSTYTTSEVAAEPEEPDGGGTVIAKSPAPPSDPDITVISPTEPDLADRIAGPQIEVDLDTIRDTLQITLPTIFPTFPYATPISGGDLQIDYAAPTVEVDISLENTGDKVIEIELLVKEEIVELPEEDLFEEALGGLGLSEEEIKEKMILEKLKEQANLMSLVNQKITTFLIDGVPYSKEFVTGSLLGTEIIIDEGILIPPGERIEETLEVRGGLAVEPRVVNVVFKSRGEEIIEKEVIIGERAVLSTAIDIDSEGKWIDLYLVVPMVEDGIQEADDYWLEFNIDQEGKTKFANLFGPFKVKHEQGFIFAQQLDYNPATYYGDSLIKTRITTASGKAIESNFKVDLGPQTFTGMVSYSSALKTIGMGAVWTLVALVLILFLVFLIFYLRKKRGKVKKVVSLKAPTFKKQVKHVAKKHPLRKVLRKILLVFKALGLGLATILSATGKLIKKAALKTAKGIALVVKAFFVGMGMIFVILIKKIKTFFGKRKRKLERVKEQEENELILEKEADKQEQIWERKVKRKEKTRARKVKASDLGTFIAGCTSQGFSKEEIKSMLLGAGWPIQIVEEHVGEIHGKVKKKEQKTVVKEKKQQQKRKRGNLKEKMTYVEEELNRLNTEGIRRPKEKIIPVERKISAPTKQRTIEPKEATPHEKRWKKKLQKNLDDVESKLRELN
ncbi:hypothetical protein GOV03_03010 [Candidatus Woesearchaeota archaeon]|nr:hypothetical protein [Candidatus Woesearchaeota archaeon]